MAAPRLVPRPRPLRRASYDSPQVVPQPWQPRRPAEVGAPASTPSGGSSASGGSDAAGSRGDAGPDQGYALTLTGRFDNRLELQPGESLADVHAGCVEVALRRASLLGRAPVIYDLEVAYTLWGFLDGSPPAELVAARRAAFSGVASPHHYTHRRALAAAVDPTALLASPAEARAAYQADWRVQLKTQTEAHAS